ncbi:hypothetical protein HYU22_05100 [Candidatus Woesearchaeota archaeon]|nr:hypothetical protein [Candidatus Woesearchaeota archaeon]
MTGSWGTAHDLRALEFADYCRRELKRDNFEMEVDGVRYRVNHAGSSVALYKNNRLTAHMGDDDFLENYNPSRGLDAKVLDGKK